jgi:hypothetical protein
VHHRFHPEIRERVSTSTAVTIQVFAVFYSVLVAFVIVGERSSTSDAAGHVTAEAAAMSALFQDVQSFPPGSRDSIRQAILAYDRSVLDDTSTSASTANADRRVLQSSPRKLR